MKKILVSGLLVVSMLVAINLSAHCGKCASDTCEFCACKMKTPKEACDKKLECTCGTECTCVKAKCPCIKKHCCNKKGKVEKKEKPAKHAHHEQPADKE